MKHTPNLHDKLRTFAIIALIVSSLAASVIFFERLLYELMGPMSPDAHIYAAVGRGIINGLVPYEHLWESKPPGMFVISALSLWMRGDLTVASALQVTVLLLIPAAMMLSINGTFTYRDDDEKPLLLPAAAIATVLLGLYAAVRSGEFQTESFGACMIVLYLVSIFGKEECMTKRNAAVAALFLLLGIGFKEPFLLTAAVAAAVVSRTRRHFVDAFVIPLLMAALAGIVLMKVFGWLNPYMNVYLPEMMGKNIHGAGRAGGFDPLLMRGFKVGELWRDISDFSLFLAFAMTLSMVTVFRRRWVEATPLGRVALVALTALSAYVTTLAVGMGGTFWTHHHVFALPVYAALVLCAMRCWRTCSWEIRSVKYTALATVCCLGIAPWYMSDAFHSDALEANLAKMNEVRMAAHYIDEILYRCHEERYLFLGHNGQQPYAYTEHSPYGPVFQQNHYWVSDSRPKFKTEFLRNLKRTPIIVESRLRVDTMRDLVRTYINVNFQEEPWRCAEGYEQIGPYKVWFRKGIH